ncbi:MAG: ribokinase, partial [Acidobacteriia bacterium]|nr:ribokinase [Terriglobia bacterium]
MSENPEIVVIGSLNADLVQNVDRLPRPGETIIGGNLQTFSGGKGANQAYAAGRMGAQVSMVGQLGNDGLASLLLQSLQSAGVRTGSVGEADLSTGAAVILVLPDGENLIVVSPGANATVTPALAAQRLSALREGWYLLSQLEIPIESVNESLAVAKARGATTILDPAPARELSPELLRKVDFLTPNETETQTLLGEPGLKMESDPDLELAARAILALGPRSVVLKLGARGCMIASVEGSHRVPGFEVSAVDTTAAGDVVNGAIATPLAEGRRVPAAARL